MCVCVCVREKESEWEEEDILVSATQGLCIDHLRTKIQEQVLRATGQQLWDIQLPCDGPHLEYVCYAGASDDMSDPLSLIKERVVN